MQVVRFLQFEPVRWAVMFHPPPAAADTRTFGESPHR